MKIVQAGMVDLFQFVKPRFELGPIIGVECLFAEGYSELTRFIALLNQLTDATVSLGFRLSRLIIF